MRVGFKIYPRDLELVQQDRFQTENYELNMIFEGFSVQQIPFLNVVYKICFEKVWKDLRTGTWILIVVLHLELTSSM